MTAYGSTPLSLNDKSQAEAARWYLDHGFRPIPWETKGTRKSVSLRGFSYEEYTTAPLDRIAQIIGQWQDEWQVGLALAEPTGLFAIDIDSWDELKQLEADIGSIPRQDDTWWQMTGRPGGGAHALFQRGHLLNDWPRHGAWSRIYPHIEVKSNGFIAVPPSMHPSGHKYQWVGKSSGITGVPLYLANQLNIRQTQRPYVVAGSNGSEGEPGYTATGLSVDELIKDGIPAGVGQDNALRDLVWSMVQQGVPDAWIRSTWQVVVDKSPLLKPDEPWTEADFERHLRGAREKLGGGLSPAELQWARRTGVSPHATVEVKERETTIGEEVEEKAEEEKQSDATIEAEHRMWLASQLIREHADGALNPTATYSHLPYSDLGSAQLITYLHPGRFHYSTQQHTWRFWDGVIHATAVDGDIGNVIVRYAEAYRMALQRIKAAAIAEGMANGDDESVAISHYESRWKEHREYRKRLWDQPRQGLLLRQMETICSISEGKFDRDPDMAACDNGVLTLGPDGVRLEPHSCDRLITKRLGEGVYWSKTAEAPVFQKFIETSIKAEDQREWLQIVLGLALFGRTGKYFLNFIGETDSGKSTLAEIMRQVFGTYACSIGVDTFLEGSKGNNEFRLHELRGMRISFASEPSPGRKIDSEAIKTLTGQDRMNTRQAYGFYVQWDPHVLVVVLANQAMRMETADIALMKRLRPIEFHQPTDLDLGLKFKLRKEMPGILRWLVEGAERGVERGNVELEPTPSMIELRENMATSVDDCLRFLEEALEEKWVKEVTPNGVFKEFITVGELYTKYTMWAAGEGISFPVGKKTFATRVGRRFPQIRSNGVRFRGLVK